MFLHFFINLRYNYLLQSSQVNYRNLLYLSVVNKRFGLFIGPLYTAILTGLFEKQIKCTRFKFGK